MSWTGHVTFLQLGGANKGCSFILLHVWAGFELFRVHLIVSLHPVKVFLRSCFIWQPNVRFIPTLREGFFSWGFTPYSQYGLTCLTDIFETLLDHL